MPAVENDPRIAFIYEEAMRGLMQQQAALESLRGRAGTLIFAASLPGRCWVAKRSNMVWAYGLG